VESIYAEYLWAARASILRVSGHVNWTTSPDLKSGIDRCLADHPARLIIDLNDVLRIDSSGVGLRIDSSGVGALVGGLQQANRNHVKFTLCGLSPVLRALLRRTCLDKVFEIRQTVKDALQIPAPQ
jgi:anti-sigma B factor antagonist